MVYLWAILLLVVNAFWLVLVLFGLPGTWLMVITTALLAWWEAHSGSASATGRPLVGMTTLAIIVGLAFLGEVVEFAAGMAGARRAGGTWRGSVGALVGGLIGAIAGTFVIPVVGSLVGACVGAGIGAGWMELQTPHPRIVRYSAEQRLQRATGIGYAAAAGRLLGTLGKLVVAALMWLVIAVAAFWP